MLENNQYAYSTPTDQQFAVDPVERAAAYGFPGVKVDGNDVEAMFEATRAARERAIAGEGPTLIEAVTMRMHGHAAHDDMKYVPNEQVEEWRARTRSTARRRALRELGVDVDALRAEVKAAIDEGTQEALADADARPGDGDRPALPRRRRGDPARDGAAPWSGFARRREPDADLTYLQAISDGCARRCATTSASS